MVIKPQSKRPHQSAVNLAIAAIGDRPNPLDDPEMAAVNPERISLDLPDGHIVGEVRVGRNVRRAQVAWIICVRSPSEGCGVA